MHIHHMNPLLDALTEKPEFENIKALIGWTISKYPRDRDVHFRCIHPFEVAQETGIRILCHLNVSSCFLHPSSVLRHYHHLGLQII